MKSLDQIRNILAAKQPNKSLIDKVIKSGIISNVNGINKDYTIIHGWDNLLALQCDDSWGRYNIRLFDYISNLPITYEEKIAIVENSSFEDAHWRWTSKHYATYSSQYNWFFFMVDDVPQGACLIYHPKTSCISFENIFYIEYLAVAPWNRVNPIEQPIFRGIGSILMREATNYAINSLGLQKGFSLHALPKAMTFYEKIGMQRLSQLDKDGLAYYEMSEYQQTTFLGV